VPGGDRDTTPSTAIAEAFASRLGGGRLRVLR
jgi:hypothetical protein